MPNTRTLSESQAGADRFGFIAMGGYGLAALLILLPLADIALGLLPLQFGNMRWRIGAAGLATGALLLPLLGLFLALTIAHVRGHRRTQYFLAGCGILAAFVLIVIVGFFALDTVQVRREIDPARQKIYDRAALKGVITQLMTIVVLVMMSLGSLRATRLGQRERARRKDGDSIVMARVSGADQAT